MGEADARRFYDRSALDPSDGFVTPEDAKAAIRQIYKDLDRGTPSVGELRDGPGIVPPVNGSVLKYDSRTMRWMSGAPAATPLVYRGNYIDTGTATSALSGTANPIVPGDFIVDPHGDIWLYALDPLGQAVWSKVGNMGKNTIPQGTADGQVMLWDGTAWVASADALISIVPDDAHRPALPVRVGRVVYNVQRKCLEEYLGAADGWVQIQGEVDLAATEADLPQTFMEGDLALQQDTGELKVAVTGLGGRLTWVAVGGLPPGNNQDDLLVWDDTLGKYIPGPLPDHPFGQGHNTNVFNSPSPDGGVPVYDAAGDQFEVRPLKLLELGDVDAAVYPAPGEGPVWNGAFFAWDSPHTRLVNLGDVEQGVVLKGGETVVWSDADQEWKIDAPLALRAMSDVDVQDDDAEDGKSLVFDSSSKKWVPGDVLPTIARDGQVLTADGGEWVPKDLPAVSAHASTSNVVVNAARTATDVAHNLKTTDVIVQVYEGPHLVSLDVRIIDGDKITVTSTKPGTYRVVVVSADPPTSFISDETLVPLAQKTVAHGLGTADLIVQVWEAGKLVSVDVQVTATDLLLTSTKSGTYHVVARRA